MLRNKQDLLVSILFIALISFSCKSKQTAVVVDSETEAKSQNELIEDILSAELKYHNISTKGSVAIGTTQAPTVFKLVKDSIVQASIRAPLLGIEVFRATFTPDSIIILDRLKKRYLAENFDKVLKEKKIDFNFYNLQSMLTNKLFVPGEKELKEKDFKKFKTNRTESNYLLATKDKNKLYYNFAMDASNRIVALFIVTDAQSHTLQWIYQDFVNDGTYTYPKKMSAKFNAENKEITLAIEYSSLEIDGKLNVDSSIPRGYDKMAIKDILSSYLKQD